MGPSSLVPPGSWISPSHHGAALCWTPRGDFRVDFAQALHTASDVFYHLLLVVGAYEAWLYDSVDGCLHLLLVRKQAPHMQPHPETREDTHTER